TPELVFQLTPKQRAEKLKRYPLGKIPVLELDDGQLIPESTIIIEYLDAYFTTGTRLISDDRDQARVTRYYDRFADLYVNRPLRQIYDEMSRVEAQRDQAAITRATHRLDTAYAMLDERLSGCEWLAGREYSMADCSLTPCLGFLRQYHPYAKWKHLGAY